MRYSNLSSATVHGHFSSQDFTFRETSLAAALHEAGLTERTHLIREPKIEGILRDRNDSFNERKSSHKIFHSET